MSPFSKNSRFTNCKTHTHTRTNKHTYTQRKRIMSTIGKSSKQICLKIVAYFIIKDDYSVPPALCRLEAPCRLVVRLVGRSIGQGVPLALGDLVINLKCRRSWKTHIGLHHVALYRGRILYHGSCNASSDKYIAKTSKWFFIIPIICKENLKS